MAGDNGDGPKRWDPESDIARDNSQWNTDQDGAICKLKKDGMTWANIGESIGRKASHVKRRFQFIKAQIEAAGWDTDSIGENWAEDMRRQGKEIPSPDKPSPAKESPPPQLSPSMRSSPAKQSPPRQTSPEKRSSPPTHAPPGRQSPTKQASPIVFPSPTRRSPSQVFDIPATENITQEADPSKRTVHARGGGGKKQNKKRASNSTPAVDNSPKTGNLKLSGKIIEKNGVKFAELAGPSSSEDSSSSSDEDDEEFDHEAEREEQKRFIYHEYWSEIYPNQKTYEPDRFWSEGDCRVLAVIEAKDEALKYKRMQAEFFNATGRMISAEIIQYKMQQGK
ncbi:hypothetical protein SCUP234_07241 [Seiridium cupressi]